MLRIVGACFLELGNDEVYYTFYSKFPQLSFFDHPPMVGWLIWLGTAGNTFHQEFFIRLFPIILGTLNIVIIYRSVLLFSERRAAVAAALLSCSSFYLSVIAGLFIMPDTGMLFFLLLAFYQLIRIVIKGEYSYLRWFLLGLFCGLGFLSKIHVLFLWFGIGVYAIFFQRKWFLSPHIYAGALVTGMLTLPVIIWNAQNDFVSFVFQGNRVSSGQNWHWDWFFKELGGSIAYNNPIVFVLIVITLFWLFRRRVLTRKLDRLILCTTLPVIIVFLFLSFQHETLPHWSAPAYTLLLLPAGVIFAKRIYIIISAFFLSVFVLFIGPIAVNTISFDHQNTLQNRLGRFDFTLDMYGWEDIGIYFKGIRERAEEEGLVKKNAQVLFSKWFPGAHIAHYVAEPNDVDYFGIGSLNALHHFSFINEQKQSPSVNDWHFYITTSHFFQDPEKNEDFLQFQLIEKFPVYKRSKIVEYVFIYRVRLKGAFDLQGHRGCRGLMPENSIPGFNRALELGVTTLEMDCVVTRDSVVVVCHDLEILPSLCDVEQPIAIFSLSLKEVQLYSCGQIANPRFPDQKKLEVKIPTLEEVIKFSEQRATELNRSKPFYNIEIKSIVDGAHSFHPTQDVFAQLLIQVLEKCDVLDRSVVQSFDVKALQEVKKINQDISTAVLVEEEVSPTKVIEVLGYIPEIYSPNYLLVTDSVVQFCHERGLRIIPWTVNDSAIVAELLKVGVDGIITDYP